MVSTVVSVKLAFTARLRTKVLRSFFVVIQETAWCRIGMKRTHNSAVGVSLLSVETLLGVVVMILSFGVVPYGPCFVSCPFSFSAEATIQDYY